MVDVQYTVLEALPASGGRELFRATRKADGRQVLVKVLPAQHRPEHLERLRNEYEIARTLPSAVRPVAFERYQGRPALVLEDFGEGSLEERLGAPLEIEPFSAAGRGHRCGGGRHSPLQRGPQGPQARQHPDRPGQRRGSASASSASPHRCPPAAAGRERAGDRGLAALHVARADRAHEPAPSTSGAISTRWGSPSTRC